ncbi:calcium and integrin-binding protein 1-like [Lutzomyia longipalpis]|uniref:calcium and integrin-binding protein 1-like n=1 Tax=Lutzomyia longipalpis TaxID=7200 RepID=UPI00248335A9|nr:calcium and integrin-binding protein 1-like [Lutzomyia longipalpis]
MGGSASILTKEQLEEYAELTYLTKYEIHYIFTRFLKLGPTQIATDFHFRFNSHYVMEEFPQLKFNPFRKEIFRIFSSQKDGHFSFEDFLDLCSVMSENCPLEVKAAWAFRILDFNGDNEISRDDIIVLLDRLTGTSRLTEDDKNQISDILLHEMDLQHTGSMSQLEFLHAMTKMPEFATSFSFRP